MKERIIIAGAGGQGIMLLGKILSQAAMRENKFVTWLPSYGAEVRGGTAHCMVIISDEEIGSPYIETADILIIMNQPSLDKFKNRLSANGLLILNNSLASEDTLKQKKVFSLPFSDIAIRLGNIKVANMAALGLFSRLTGIVSLKNISRVIHDIAPEGKEDLIKINIEALHEEASLK